MSRNDKARLRRRSVACVGVIGLLRGNAHDGGIAALGNIPVADLLPVLVGIPALTAAVGWLFGGREAPAVAHPPIE